MPKSSSGEEFIVDGIAALDGGVNSGVLPQLLQKNQVAFGTNCTFRGGYVTHRPTFVKQAIDYGGNALLQSRVEQGIWQGAAFFRSEYGQAGHVVALSGRIFFFVATPSGFTVQDITPITNGVDDPDSQTAGIVWMWQSERWMIINDGVNLPIFYDGNISRRSRGATQNLGVTSVNFVVPAIGATVPVTLVNPYTGPLNETILIGSAFYQVLSGGITYQLTLENIGNPYGLTNNTGDQVLTGLSSYLGVIDTFNQPGPIWNFTLTELNLQTPSLTLGSSIYVLNNPGTGFATVQPGPPWTVGFAGPYTMAGQSFVFFAKGSPAFKLGNSTSFVVGQLTAPFVPPALGGTVNAFVNQVFKGAVGSIIFIGNTVYKITALAPTPIPSNIITVMNIGSVAGATVNAGAILHTVPELPAGKMGAYGMGRNAMCLVDGRSFIIGDIVGGPSGSPLLANRDSVLRITENAYLAGGGVFVVPGNVGDIRAMIFTANLDQSLGQGPLQVGTPTTVFSVNTPVDRTTWNTLTNPILTESLKGKGPLGQYSTILVNSDTMFRANDGIGSLILARRDFDVWGNTPISREVQNIINLDDQTLLVNATAIDFDNRMIMSCLPVNSAQGVYHQGLLALNFDGISNLRGKSPTIYDGFWTGLNVFQLLTGRFAETERAFAFALNTSANRLELFEILPTDDANNFDNHTQPITWSFETAALFTNLKDKGTFDLIELLDSEIYVSNLVGAAQIETWYRAENDPCWHTWMSFGICAKTGQPLQYRTRLGLGQPDAKDCDPVNNRPARLGTNFQVRFQITGSIRFMGEMLKSMPSPETEFSAPICKPLCDLIGELTNCEPCKELTVCQQFPLVFYSLSRGKTYSNPFLTFNVLCANGQIVQSTVAAGTVNFTLPFPSGYTGEYPPLVLQCQAGGIIVRFIPPGATQGDIDTIVNSMITECAQAIAQANAPCVPVSFSSAQVVYPVTCPIGQTLTFTGTLPSWITLDAANGQLIGAAGTFTGATNAEATATAQAALNTFGDAQVLAGNLFCAAATNVCVDGVGTLANNRYGVVGYFDGMIVNNKVAGSAQPTWDGSFNSWFSTALQGWSSGETNTYSVQSKTWCIALLWLDCMGGDTPNWFVNFGDNGVDWVGQKVGGSTPVGVYNLIGGLDGAPLTISIELLPGVTAPLSGSTSCTS